MENPTEVFGKRISSLEDKISSLDEKVTALVDIVIGLLSASKTIDQNFDIVNKKLDSLYAESGDGFTKVGEKLEVLKTEINKIQKVYNYSAEYDNLLKVYKK